MFRWGYLVLFLLSQSTNLVDADLFVTANTYELIGFIGNSVTMYATVRGNPRPVKDNITWLKMQGNLPEGRYTVEYDLSTNESRLRITELKYADAGTYFCQANVNGVSKVVQMTLKVVVEPKVERVSAFINVKGVGQTVSFTVAVSGDPVPTENNMTWAKLDNRSLPTIIETDRWSYSDAKKIFTISNLNTSDDGWYKCLVITNEGRAEADFSLVVIGMKSIQKDEYGIVGGTAQMTCTATYSLYQTSSDDPQIIWYKLNDPETPLTGSTITRSTVDGAVSTLILTDLSWEDEGDYFCTASYIEFPSHSLYSTTLNLRGIKPVLGTTEAVLGTNAVLTCDAHGEIQGSINWTYNMVRPLSTSISTYSPPRTTSFLTISGVTMADVGDYTCTALWDEKTGSVSETTTLSLNYVKESSGSVFGVEDNEASLSCESVGNIDPVSWTWTDGNGTNLSHLSSEANKKSVLVLPSITRFVAGLYTCTADYGPELGVYSRVSSLVAGHVSVNPDDTFVSFGRKLSLVCRTNLKPNRVKWFKDKVEIKSDIASPDPTTSLLTISNAKFSDIGRYYCSPEWNGVSTKSSEAQVYVRGFTSNPQDVTTVNETAATLECVGSGDTPPDIKWYQGATELSHNSSISISSKDHVSAMGYTSTTKIIISGVTRSQTGIYCKARWNGVDVISDTASITVIGVSGFPEATSGVAGTPATLTCSVSADKAVITWYHNGTTVDASDVTAVTPQVSELRINKVTWQTAGLYGCKVYYPDYGKSYISPNVLLSVYGILESPASGIYYEGDTIRMECRASGATPPALTWYKDDTILSESTGYSSDIKILDSTVSDSGRYYCIANYDNSRFVSSDTAYIQIRGFVDTGSMNDIVVVKSNGAKLTCVIRADTPPDNIVWFDGNTPVSMDTNTMTTTTKNNDTTSVITLSNVMDGGMYFCRAIYQEPSGMVDSSKINLKMLDFDQNPESYNGVLGHPIPLTCVVEGNPYKITWQHNNTAVTAGVSSTSKGSSLVIASAKLSSAGEYRCIASYKPSEGFSGGDQESGVAMVTVSSFVQQPRDKYIVAGNKVSLTCVTTDHVIPTFSWSNENVVNSNGVKSVAVWEDVTVADEGEYTCTAKFADHGLLTSSPATVYVRAITKEPESKIVLYGGSAVLTCGVHGVAMTTVFWTDSFDNILKTEDVKGSTDYESVLEVSDLKQETEIKCSVDYKNPDETIHSDLAIIFVYNFKAYTSNVTIIAGQSAKLTCEAEGSPVISWRYANTTAITENIHNSSPGVSHVTITGVTTDAEVKCVVKYEKQEGISEGGYLVSKVIPILVNEVSNHPRNTTTVIGTPFTLRCTGENDPLIEWYKDNTMVGSGTTYTVQASTRSDDGAYHCRMTWEQGYLNSNRGYVTTLGIAVQPMPGIAVTGGKTSASCTADGEASFVWYKNGAVIKPGAVYSIETTTSSAGSTKTTLSVANVTKSTQGTYLCEAVYEASSDILVGGTVRSNPATLTVYRMLGNPEDKYVLVGEDITLQCALNYSASIVWYHNDKLIGRGDDTLEKEGSVISSLQLNDAKWSDDGYYYCEGTFAQGKIKSSPAKVFVRGVWKQPQDTEVVSGTITGFTCEARGESNITWTYGGKSLPSTDITYSESNRLTVAKIEIGPINGASAKRIRCDVEYTGSSPASTSSEFADISLLRITKPPAAMAGLYGSTVTLSCSANGNPSMLWQKESFGVIPVTTNVTTVDDITTSYLVFDNLQIPDKGRYKCVADYGTLGEMKSKFIVLDVYYFTEAPVSVEVKEGEVAELTCKSSGVPEKVRWFKNNNEVTTDNVKYAITTQENNSTFQVISSELVDTAAYSCIFEFDEGDIESQPVTIVVRGFHSKPNDVIGVQDNSVKFSCEVHGDTKATITWLLDGKKVTTGIVTKYTVPFTTSILTIRNLEYGVHHGNIVACKAEYPDLTLTSGNAKITVKRIREEPRNRITVVSEPVTLNCNADLPGVVQWYNASVPMADERGNKLIISKPTIYDQSSYFCKVNYSGDNKTVFGGTITSKSAKITVNTIKAVSKEVYGNVGDPVLLTCSGSGAPTFRWIKGYKKVLKAASGELKFSAVKFSDEAVYQCHLVYEEGVLESDNIHLYVRGISSKPSSSKGVLGNNVIFTCTAKGDLRATMSWTRNYVKITGSSEEKYEAPYTSTVFTYGRIAEDDDTADFRCHAYFDDRSDEAVSNPVSVNVLKVGGPPSDAYALRGKTATLTCETNGNPNPETIAWIQDTNITRVTARDVITSLTPVKSQLVVNDILASDGGEYACVASYDEDHLFPGGDVTSPTATLSVIGIVVAPSQTIVKIGDDAEITCAASATPTPTITWYKNSVVTTAGVLPPDRNGDIITSKLVVEKVGKDDVAGYKCRVQYPGLGEQVSPETFLRFRGIEIPPATALSVIGEAITFNCTARGESPCQMNWYGNDTRIEPNEAFSIRSVVDTKANLNLVDTFSELVIVSLDKETSFLRIKCEAVWPTTRIESSPVSFIPLYVLESPKSTVAVRYTKVTFSCVATHTPTIRWDRYGRTYGNDMKYKKHYDNFRRTGTGYTLIDPQRRYTDVAVTAIYYSLLETNETMQITESVLTIGNVTSADDGKVWCVAIYEQGSHESDKAVLTVVGIISEPVTERAPARGKSVQFTCVVDRFPDNVITWYKGSDVINSTSKYKIRTTIKEFELEQTLEVRDVQPDDADQYFCKVTYPQGEQISQPASIVIQEAPEITLLLTTADEDTGIVELLCQASGIPVPAISWKLNGQKFPDSETSMSEISIYQEPGSSRIIINNTNINDEGMYTCVAFNGIGVADAQDMELLIQEPVKAVTVATASSLIAFIIIVCTALMLFAIYRKRKRRRPVDTVQGNIYAEPW